MVLYNETSRINNYDVELTIGEHSADSYFANVYIYNANDDARRNLLYYATYWASPLLHEGYAVYEGGFIETNLYPFEIHQIVSSVHQLFQAIVNNEVSFG